MKVITRSREDLKIAGILISPDSSFIFLNMDSLIRLLTLRGSYKSAL